MTAQAPDRVQAIAEATYRLEKAVAGLSGTLPANVTAQVVEISPAEGRVVVVIKVGNNAVRGAAEPRTLDGLVRPSGVSE